MAGLLADLLGAPGGAIALVLALIPFALALHFTRALGVLDQPIGSASELTVPAEPDLART